MHTEKILHFDAVQLLPIEKSPESHQQTIKKKNGVCRQMGFIENLFTSRLKYLCTSVFLKSFGSMPGSAKVSRENR